MLKAGWRVTGSTSTMRDPGRCGHRCHRIAGGIPDIPGIDIPGVYTYQTLHEMDDLPRRMVVIGGGVVAAEFAHIFRSFGSGIDIVTRRGLLPGFDAKLRSAMIRHDLAGINIHKETAVGSIEGGARVRSVLLASGEEIDADAVLLATGLVPRSELLQGLRKRPDGAVVVDRRMRTSVEGVYAAGDVIGPPYLTPAARREGVVAAQNILGHPAVMDYTGIPQVLSLRYDYAVATTGTADDGSINLSAPSPAGSGSFWDVAAGWSGVAQIRVDPGTGRIIRVAAGVPGASPLLSYIGYLMKQGITASDFDDIVEVHPSTDGVYGLARYAAGMLRKRGGLPGSELLNIAELRINLFFRTLTPSSRRVGPAESSLVCTPPPAAKRSLAYCEDVGEEGKKAVDSSCAGRSSSACIFGSVKPLRNSNDDVITWRP